MSAAGIVTLPKSSVPYIGIPIEGARPFVVRRELFVGATKGIKVTDWSVTGEPGSRVLEIAHCTGRVRGRYKFWEQDARSWQVRKAINDWREAQLKSRAKPKLDKREQVVARLRRELNKLERTPNANGFKGPLNPVLAQRPNWHGDYYRNQEANWHADKAKRKALARIAGLWIGRKLTSVKAYAKVREVMRLPYTFGSLPTHLSRELLTETGYWRALPIVCGLASEPSNRAQGEPEERLATRMEQHKIARLEYAVELRQAQALREQIADLERAQ